jgi:dihydroflavonol-4-reductase
MGHEPDSWAGRPVCVTGGTGFLGLHLVRQLLGRGARVTVLALPPRPDHQARRLAGVRMVFGDVRDAAAVHEAVTGCSVVFHTAGVVAVSGPALAHMFAVHTDGTRNVLSAAAPGARIVHTTSVVAIGPAVGRRPVAEDSPFTLANRRLPYVAAKRAAEELALAAAAAGRDVVIVNPTYLVGPEDYDGSLMGRFCHRFWRGRMQLVSPGGVNVVDVRDAAAGHVLAAERGRAGRRYILGGTDQTYAALAAELARAAGLRPRTTAAAPRWAVFGPRRRFAATVPMDRAGAIPDVRPGSNERIPLVRAVRPGRGGVRLRLPAALADLGRHVSVVPVAAVVTPKLLRPMVVTADGVISGRLGAFRGRADGRIENCLFGESS